MALEVSSGFYSVWSRWSKSSNSKVEPVLAIKRLSESFIDNVVFLIVGAILGFLSSVGTWFLQQRVEKKGYRDRLRQELELIREEINEMMKQKELSAKAFQTEFFSIGRGDLVGNVDAKTWKAVLDAYVAIDQLRLTKNQQALYQENYETALRAVHTAIESLS